MTINAFLELFECIHREFGLQYKDIWNMDEFDITLGLYANSQLLTSSSKKKTYIKSSQNRESVSIIECVSAVGIKL